MDRTLTTTSLPKSADVVIVGGGAVGTAIAYFLAQRQVDVCLVERGDIASGTTSAAANGVALQTKPPGPKQELARASVRLYHQLVERLEGDIEFLNQGSLLVAETEEEMALVVQKSKKAIKAGLPIKLLSAEQTRRMLPSLAPHVVGSAYCREDATVNPYLTAFVFAQNARRLGATLLPKTAVTGIERHGGKISSVVTTRGRIATEKVVCACGAWSAMLAKMVDVEVPIEPRKGELFVTAPGPPVMRGIVISASYLLSKAMPQGADKRQMTAGVYAAQAKRGNLVVGSTREFAGYDRSSTVRGMYKLVEQTVRLMPIVGKLHILRFYGGLRPSTPDGMPIIGPVRQQAGFFMASGHEGDGVALSPITGHSIACYITGDWPLLDLSPFRLERFH